MRILPLAALLLFAAGSASAANQPSFEGSWWGLLDAGPVKLHVAFRLHHDKGAWTGELASPDQGTGWIPINGVTVDGDTLKLDLSQLHASYEGKRAGKDRVTGTLTQGAPLPLDLQRGEVPTLRRPQEPRPPFPYAIEDVSVPNKAAAVELGCTLTHPKAPRFPVVILITGSGHQDRDESILGHKPFWVLADALGRQGIGALRCDDRGGDRSTGNFAKATTLDFAGDVEAELAWVKARPDVDGKHIGLLGHSEGGLIAPIVASRSKDVAFLVLLAGTGLRGDEIIVRQTGLVARAEGAGDKKAAQEEAQQQQVVAILVNEKDDGKARRKLEALLAPPRSPAGTPPSAAVEQQLRTLLSPWYRTFLTLDPQPYLHKVKVPVLALNGARDVQVPPAEDLAAIRAGLAGDADVTVRELPGLNHLFQTCKRCSVSEYQTLEETMAPAALQLVVSWVHGHVR